MTIVFWVAVYFIIWWLTLFLVLPFGVRSQAETGDVIPGTPAGAPARPRMLRTLLVTTFVAGLFFGLTYAVLEVPALRAMVSSMFGI